MVEGAYLKDSERNRLYESVLDQVNEQIYVIRTNYRFEFANQRVIEFEGWRADEIIGRHVIDIVGTAFFKRLAKPRLDRCFRGEHVNFQYWLTTRSGQRHYVDVMLTPFREWNGEIIASIVTIRDKTVQKRLQEKLKDQADLYRRLIKNSLAGVAILKKGAIVFANQTMATIFGYPTAKDMLALGKPFAFIAPDDRDRLQLYQDTDQARRRGPGQYKVKGLCRDGSSIDILVSVDRVSWKGRAAVQLIVIDISRQMEAERALKETAASFQTVTESALQGFFVARNDCIIHANQAYINLFGRDFKELQASPVFSFYAAHEHQRLCDYRDRRLAGGTAPEIYEVDAVHKDGRIFRLLQCVRLVDNWFGERAILGFVIDVTEAHLAKEALEEEHNLLRSIIDNIPAVVFAKDRGGHFLIKNKAGAEFIGEPNPSFVIGKSNTDYYPKHVVERFRALELDVMETGQPLIDDEHEITCPSSGETISVSGCLAPLRNGSDEIIGIVGVSQDITAYRRSEAAFRESEKRFKDLVDVAFDWFWEMDENMCFSCFSEGATEREGHYPHDATGKPRTQFMLEMDDNWRAHLDDLAHRRPFRDFRYAKRGSDGSVHYTSVSGIPIFDGQGRYKGYRGAAMNVDKEVKTQQALAKERNLLRAIINNIPDAIYAKDRDARFILKNDVDAKLMGADSSSETIGKTDFDYFPKEMAAVLFQDDMSVIKTGTPIINKMEQLVRNEDGQPVWYSTTKVPLRDSDGNVVGLVGIGRDVTESKALADRLHYQATHDSLTGLVNRTEFERQLELTLTAAKTEGRSSVLCYIDLDQFKMLNDSAGHMAGDQLLRQLAHFFKEQTAAYTSVLARLGGDEFGLLLEDCTLEDGETLMGCLIPKANAIRFLSGQHSYNVGLSVGVTLIDREVRDVSALFAQADIACYAAKDSGRNRFCVYSPRDHETRGRHDELLRAASLQKSLERDQMVLVAQPILRLSEQGDVITHYEILLRLCGRDNELLLPGVFIPAAERYGLMPAIDRWVVRKALSMLRDTASSEEGRRFSINLSGHSLADDAFHADLRAILAKADMPAGSLCFEITETAVISNLARAKQFVGELRAMGCRIALDDFGCGLSSFSYLKQFPVDYIKIDGSFIENIVEDETDRAIVQSINHVGHVCQIETVAECVADDALLAPLRALKIDYAQGLALGGPVPLADIIDSL